MRHGILATDRRDVLAGLAGAAVSSLFARAAPAQGAQVIRLEARAASLRARPLAPAPIWEVAGPDAPLRLLRGTELTVMFRNSLPVPAILDWRGLDGAAQAEPWTGRPPLPSGGHASFTIVLRRAGTFFCDLVASGETLPTRPLPVVVEEGVPLGADRDAMCVVEEWRLRPDGTAWAPGTVGSDASPPIYTVNGEVLPEISFSPHERLRMRVVNFCQRRVIALKIEGHEARVIALDSAPADPFAARDGVLVLAPGGRADAVIDVAGAASQILLYDGVKASPIATLSPSGAVGGAAPREAAPPLPDDGLPARLDLRRAVRVDLALDGPDWVVPGALLSSRPPAFSAEKGRTIVLALNNRIARPTVFHLHGHHFRLLDRLDDGWKPFWLDTLAVEPGQTQRIAFLAEHGGRWPIESTCMDWTAPRLARWHSVA